MRRGTKIAAAAAGVLIGVPALAVALLLIIGNTGAGRHLMERLTSKLTGGTVVVTGLSGRFPDALQLAHGEIRDDNGVWLSLDGLTLDWSPLALLRGEARVERFAVAHLVVVRLPSDTSKSSSSSKGATLPLRVAVDALQVDRLDLGAALAGAPATLRLQGHLQLASLERGDVALSAERLDAPGSYKLDGKIDRDRVDAQIAATEPVHGLIGGLANLPELGALAITASVAGPRTAEAAQLAITAGPLRADGQGKINLTQQVMDVDITATAPAMSPRADLRWQAARLEAHVHGAFTSPEAVGHFELDDLAAGGAGLSQLKADVQGSAGKLTLTAALAGLHLPGTPPDLFGTTPFTLRADAELDTPSRPVTFSLSHPLITVTGQGNLGGDIAASLTATLPQLAPFASLAGIDAQGHAALTANVALHDDATRITAGGTVTVTGGAPYLTGLLGDTSLSLGATLQGGDVTLDDAKIDGAALHATASGSRKKGALDLAWSVALPDLSRAAPTISGALTAQGRVQGPPENMVLDAEINGDVATAGLPKGPLKISLHVDGLPDTPAGNVAVQGSLAGAPVQLVAQSKRDADGTIHVSIERAQWKSADAKGELTLPTGAIFPLGHLQLRMARLGDLTPFIGMPIAGSVDASLDTVQARGKPQAQVHIAAQKLGMNGGTLDKLTLDARVDDPATHPTVAMQLTADGIADNGITGGLKLEANGPQEALALRLTSALQTPEGPVTISAAATARLPQRELRLTALQVEGKGETLRLLSPARLTAADGVAIDSLRLGVDDAVLTASGRVMPKLALTVSLHNASPSLAAPFVPGFAAGGTITMDAKLGGTLAAPTGTVRVSGRQLRMRSGPGQAIPAADFTATAELQGNSTRLNAQLTAGAAISLKLAGTAPFDITAPFDLHANGSLDLVVLDPILTPNGRTARGRATLDLAIAGTAAAPRVTGTVRLADGSVQDFVQGVHITDIEGLLQADGDTLRLTRLAARAGRGTLSLSGTLGLEPPGFPIDLTLTARNARPLASDLLTATMDADLTLRGQIDRQLNLAGQIRVSRADINIPERFPQSIAVLDVQRPGRKPPPPAAPGLVVGLDLTVSAPEQVFIRGHGLDAEMGGRLTVSGTSVAPQIAGGFDLRRGTFSIAGQTLNFTSGRVAFDGSGVTGKLDPTLNFLAQSSGYSVTANLQITGYADAPKIQLSSSPNMPQDEILAHLLFGQSVKQLSPFQLAEIAQALASLGGVGGSFDPLASVRNRLGLDRLSVSGATGGGLGATVAAGKYITNGVYVGTKQSTSGGTQAQVQIDLTKHLKLETTLGTGGGTPATGATLDNDPGSSIGLTYQFEY